MFLTLILKRSVPQHSVLIQIWKRKFKIRTRKQCEVGLYSWNMREEMSGESGHFVTYLDTKLIEKMHRNTFSRMLFVVWAIFELQNTDKWSLCCIYNRNSSFVSYVIIVFIGLWWSFVVMEILLLKVYNFVQWWLNIYILFYRKLKSVSICL